MASDHEWVLPPLPYTIKAFRAEPLIDRLEAAPAAFRVLVVPLPIEDLRFVPVHGGWSIAEILGHLAEE